MKGGNHYETHRDAGNFSEKINQARQKSGRRWLKDDLLLVDSTSTTDLLISDDKGVNWNTVQTGSFTDGKISKTNPIISAYYDRANSKLYYLMDSGRKCEDQFWVIDINNWENYKVGDIIEGEITGVFDFGVFIKFLPIKAKRTKKDPSV